MSRFRTKRGPGEWQRITRRRELVNTERAAATGCTGTHSYQQMGPILDYVGICPPSQRPWSCTTSSAWVDAVGCTSLDAVQAGAR